MEFKAICPQCSKDIELSPEELEGLEAHVDRECKDAVDEAKADADDEDALDELVTLVDGRAWRDLAAAIRAGNRDEAEYLLDRIAGEAGDKVVHEVSLGRFGTRIAA